MGAQKRLWGLRDMGSDLGSATSSCVILGRLLNLSVPPFLISIGGTQETSVMAIVTNMSVGVAVADHPAPRPLLTGNGSLPSSTGIREAERFGTPPGRASSITRAGKEENSSGIKYKAGRVSRSMCLPGHPAAWEGSLQSGSMLPSPRGLGLWRRG